MCVTISPISIVRDESRPPLTPWTSGMRAMRHGRVGARACLGADGTVGPTAGWREKDASTRDRGRERDEREGHRPVRHGWHGRTSQRLPRERASWGDRERVITECDLARVGQLRDRDRERRVREGKPPRETVEIREMG